MHRLKHNLPESESTDSLKGQNVRRDQNSFQKLTQFSVVCSSKPLSCSLYSTRYN